MAIVQLGKLIQRSGSITDLSPGVLSEAELGFATDANRLFIGTTAGGNIVEVLTSFSNIDFGQITGSGNITLDITPPLLNGQVLAYDAAGNSWTNKGNTKSGLIDLGNVANVRISDGAIGYVLETDGYGNLTWTSKGTITAPIRMVHPANPGIMTVDPKIPYVNFNEITVSGVGGTNADALINGRSFYIRVAVDYPTSGNVELYQDALCTIPVNTTTVVATPLTGQAVSRVGSLANFAGGSNTTIQINNSGILDGSANLKFNPVTSNLSLTGNAAVTGNVSAANFIGNFSGNFVAPGANTQVLFNDNTVLGADAGFTYNKTTDALTVVGNIAGGNITTGGQVVATGNLVTAGNVNAAILNSNVAVGTPPLQVISTTRVANLNVAYANVSDNSNIADATTGNHYFALSATATGNTALKSNASIYANLTTGTVYANAFSGNISGNIAAPGANTQVVFNNAGVLGAVAGMTFNNTNNQLSVTGNVVGGNLVTTGLANVGSLTVAGTSNLGAVGNVTITGGTAGQVLTTDGAGVLTWSVPTAGILANAGNTTGINPTTGQIYGDWTLTAGSSIQATYADLAEAYSSDKKYPEGTVLAIGGEKEVTLATRQHRHRLIGIVSSNPAYVLNAMAPDSVVVALAGRVPCKVIGKIYKGDMLTISDQPGIACASPIPAEYGTVIGRALEDYQAETPGMIEVKVDRG